MHGKAYRFSQVCHLVCTCWRKKGLRGQAAAVLNNTMYYIEMCVDFAVCERLVDLYSQTADCHPMYEHVPQQQLN